MKVVSNVNRGKAQAHRAPFKRRGQESAEGLIRLWLDSRFSIVS
jgi:hypothetical protein